jgi:beta-mannan synthase
MFSFVFTLFALGVFTHPKTMVVAHEAVSRASTQGKMLHKIVTDPERRQEAWMSANERANVISEGITAVRFLWISPCVQFAVGVLALLSSLVAADRFFHCYVAFYWRYISRKSALKRFDYFELEGDEAKYPSVVVQLPMFNETDVCAHVIQCAREIQWPRNKFLIQVLDDSTCAETRETIEECLHTCNEQGVQTQYRWRSNRTGYKAGAMAEAMDDIVDYDYVCVFDADFSPEPDFLLKTIPWIHSNPQCGFVQARWVYANASENLLTRVQSISLNYHIRCEQFARFSAGLFFNFNGTAGVWRRTCIEDAGGWDCRSTVEDLDLSLRAHLRRWKFIFLDHVTCLNEIPAQYDAFRKQQHRWSAGPMALWRKAMTSIWEADIPFASKLYLNIFFFGTRMAATHLVSFFFYLLLIPLCATMPEVVVPFWALVYAPVLVTISTCTFTKNGLLYAIPYVLFENANTLVKLNAMISGLLGLEHANEWVVTTKLGKWVAQKVERAKTTRLARRLAPTLRAKPFHFKELLMSVFFLFCAVWGVLRHRLFGYGVFLCLQSAVFAVFGFNVVDAL